MATLNSHILKLKERSQRVQYFYIFKLLAHSAWSVDFDELYRNHLCQEAVNNRKDNLGER